MRADDPVVAIACADLHLSHKPPLARCDEENWYEAMRIALDQITALQKKYNVPVLCAGDVFDHWRCPPELITFAIQHLPPRLCAVPGQHDMPEHSMEQLKRSAFWTLVEAQSVDTELMDDVGAYYGQNLCVCGFGYGQQIGPPRDVPSNKLKICVAHQYVWWGEHKYEGALGESNVSNIKGFGGYDVVVLGDNHKGFCVELCYPGPIVFNCGTLMRRKTDEVDYKPMVGLIHRSGKVQPYYLDTRHDRIRTVVDNGTDRAFAIPGFEEFLGELCDLQATVLDFATVLERIFLKRKTPANVQKAILEAMDNG